MPKYKCNNCNSISDSPGFCNYCGCQLKIYYDYNDIADITGTQSLICQIKKLGARKCWDLINKNYRKAETRIKVRELFFKAMDELGLDKNKLF